MTPRFSPSCSSTLEGNGGAGVYEDLDGPFPVEAVALALEVEIEPTQE